ncbi:hypothetical protein EI555_013705, partial [Monodon monoceros]
CAANMAAAVGRDTLPEHWSYGVCRDGRVFFINDQLRCTTWLHPRTGEPVNSGHMIRSDLPRGWEEGFTEEGASYFIESVINFKELGRSVSGKLHAVVIEDLLDEVKAIPLKKDSAQCRAFRRCMKRNILLHLHAVISTGRTAPDGLAEAELDSSIRRSPGEQSVSADDSFGTAAQHPVIEDTPFWVFHLLQLYRDNVTLVPEEWTVYKALSFMMSCPW